jgi:hypothetical protein
MTIYKLYYKHAQFDKYTLGGIASIINRLCNVMRNFKLIALIVVMSLPMLKCNTKHNESFPIAYSKDTLALLTNSKIKFWDITSKSKYTNDYSEQNLNWMFSSDKKLLVFDYDKRKRLVHAYGGDFIAGSVGFEFYKDTLFLGKPIDEKYLIKKISPDSLLVQQCFGPELKDPVLFIRSPDQKTIPEF